jgi:ABC-type transport system substrate-binding protein
MATNGYWLRYQRQRISRRRLLAAAGVTGGGLAVAVACGGGGGGGATATPGEGETPTAGEPVRGGRYVYAITGDWGTIDPVTSVAFAPGIFPRIYNCLVDRSRLDPNFFYFDLAEELEQPDEETYNFIIRPGVRINANTLGIEERDLDSGDAKAWLDRVQEDEAAVIRAFTNLWLDSYDAPDPQTFVLKTKGAYAYTLFRIGAPLGGTIPPREFFEQDISLQDKGVGAGPFTIVEGSYSNTGGIRLARSATYYRTDEATGEQLPYLDEIEAVRISDQQPRRAAFVDGQIHTYGAEDKDEADQLLSQVAGSYVVEDPANTFIAFTMNPEREPWTDERIRMAANFALNRQEYVDRIVGTEGGRIDGLVHWPLGDFALPPEELEELQPYDPERARELIREATGNDTITINVIYPVSEIEFHDKHLPIWLQQMQAAGFNVNEQPQDFTTWLANYQNLEYDASLSLNQIYETPEIPIDFHAAAGPQGDRNFAIGIGGLYPEIEEAIQASKRVTDPDEQIETIREVQRMLYAKGPAFLPLMSWISFTLYQGSVKNIPRGLGATGLYLNNWWLDPSG